MKRSRLGEGLHSLDVGSEALLEVLQKMKSMKILGFFRPLTWIYGLRPPALKFMGCILK